MSGYILFVFIITDNYEQSMSIKERYSRFPRECGRIFGRVKVQETTGKRLTNCCQKNLSLIHICGGHQQLDFPAGKGGHDGFTFLRAHFAMQHTHLIALKGSAGKGVGVLLCILQVGWGIFHRLYQRTDDVPLQTAVQMVLQKTVGARLELGADDIGFDRLTVGRQLVDGGNVQIAVNQQRQRAGNRGCLLYTS